MLQRIIKQSVKKSFVSNRTFTSASVRLASEDPNAQRLQRLAEFQEKIRNNTRIHQQLKSVQLVIASKMDVSSGSPPSLMQQLQLLSNKEVRDEMVKLSEIMKEENINLNKEDVGFLMQALKAQMDKEDK